MIITKANTITKITVTTKATSYIHATVVMTPEERAVYHSHYFTSEEALERQSKVQKIVKQK